MISEEYEEIWAELGSGNRSGRIEEHMKCNFSFSIAYCRFTRLLHRYRRQLAPIQSTVNLSLRFMKRECRVRVRWF